MTREVPKSRAGRARIRPPRPSGAHVRIDRDSRAGAARTRPRPRFSRSRGEAAQRAADIPFAEALERAIAELTSPLARHAKHRADLLERVLAAAFEPEVEPEHLRVTRRQRSER